MKRSTLVRYLRKPRQQRHWPLDQDRRLGIRSMGFCRQARVQLFSSPPRHFRHFRFCNQLKRAKPALPVVLLNLDSGQLVPRVSHGIISYVSEVQFSPHRPKVVDDLSHRHHGQPSTIEYGREAKRL